MTSLDVSVPNRWRSLPIFLALAFPLSWYPWALHAAGYPGNGNPNPLGVLVAALIASAVDAGWRGPVAVLRSIVRIGVAPSLWLAAIGIPALALGVSIAIAYAEHVPFVMTPPPWSDLLDRFVFTLL